MIKVTFNNHNEDAARTAEVNDGVTVGDFVKVNVKSPAGSFNVIVNGAVVEADSTRELRDGDRLATVPTKVTGA